MQALIYSEISALYQLIMAFEHSIITDQVFTLWWLRDQSEDRYLFALTGYQKTGILTEVDLSDVEGDLEQITPQEGEPSLVSVKPPLEKKAIRCLIDHQRTGVHLKAILPLQPWSGGVPPEVMNAPVFFWVQDRRVAAKLIMDHFKMGCDRIDYLAFEPPNGEHTSLLFRVSDPSYYLIQCYLQDVDDHEHLKASRVTSAVRIYYTFAEGLSVEWGYEPALAKRWIDSFSRSDGQHTFMPMTMLLAPIHLERPTWQSIYELTTCELTPTEDIQWSVGEASDVRFTIPLSLERRARSVDPELWLIDAEDFDQLERRLSLIDQEDLDGLLISVHETKDGRKRFFLRDRPRPDQSRRFFDLGGERYASYMGFHNLYLPVDIEIQPRLRRDQYPDLFKLQNREFTVLSLEGPQSDFTPQLSEATLYRFAEQSFEPLSALTDYIINAASSRLQSVAQQSIFTLKSYANAPSLLSEERFSRLQSLMTSHAASKTSRRSVSIPRTDQSGHQPPPVDATIPDIPSSLAEQLGVSQPTKSPKKKSPRTSHKIKNPKPSDLESRVTKLLTALLTHDALTSDELSAQWFEIASVLTQLNKISEATEAIIEAAFECRATGDHRWDQRMTQLDKLISAHSDEWYAELPKQSDDTPLSEVSFALIKRSNVSKSFCDALSILHRIEKLPVTMRHEPLTRYLELITEVAEKWRKKERWLIWWKLANLNNDPRLLARERELLLNQLNEEGVTKTDLPRIVIHHLLQHRIASQESSHRQEGEAPQINPQLRIGMSYLQEIRDTLSPDDPQDPLHSLRAPLHVLLARAYHENSLIELRDESLEKLAPLLERSPPSMRCWILLHLTRSEGLISSAQTKDYQDLLSSEISQLTSSDRERVFAVLKHLTQRNQRMRARERLELSSEQSQHRLFLGYDPKSDPELYKLFEKMARALRIANLADIKTHFNAMAEMLVSRISLSDDLRSASYCLHQLKKVSGKLKLLDDQELFLRALERLNSEAQKRSANRTIGDLYLNLCLLNLSEMTLRLGNHRYAQRQIATLLRELTNRKTIWLDHIDSASLALKSIESVEYESRLPLLQEVLIGLKDLISRNKIATELIICNFVEQLVEVAMNDDMLVANRIQERCDREELTLRSAMINDRI